MYLEKINQTNDIKKIEKAHLPELAQEIREFLIEKISVRGGHLAANLGCVELTMALHLALNLPKDKIVWDVGHQSYTHKLLTGRKREFDTLRTFGGLSGFPKRSESPCDSFNTGHSSTSVSAGLGMVVARDRKKEDNTIVAVIGDGALTGGMAYEALNNASKLDTNYIIILNDNKMSISENVGGISKYLNTIRTTDGYLDLKADVYQKLLGAPYGETMVEGIRKVKNKVRDMVIPGTYFEDMGITYMGPVDGHDIAKLTRFINDAKTVKGAVLIHVETIKGKGFAPAERHPARFHGAEPFDIQTGLPSHPRTKSNYTDIFSTVMIKLAQRDERVVAITAAMPDGTGLKRFRNIFPERFFDVGIAEEHAVTCAAGMAAEGLRPIVAIYSSFLQRAYDQIMHDVCIQKLPVIFAIDRAGLVGSDGETHQGIFDLSFLATMPNMTIMAPKNKWELSDMLKFALTLDGPVAIRYPRGEAYDGLAEFRQPVEDARAEVIYPESDIALLAVGSMVRIAEQVRENLKEQGYSCSLINARFVKPLDEDIIKALTRGHRLIVTMEENIRRGGFGEAVRDVIDRLDTDSKVLPIAIEDQFVPQGSVGQLLEMLQMDADSITERIIKEHSKGAS
ncbi:MAG: 1-deoxy-D-xylulose-5-phosphate synthase [Lachnospiraceae bacterium]|nr:1-deoxy-D-xylulose-5-phosphate synthase [Lachnospiraceae bacterium]